jgi:hypothetical protein
LPAAFLPLTRKPAVAVAVAMEVAVAVVTWVAVVEAIWAALAAVTSAASAQATSAVSAGAAWAVSAEVTSRACTEITLAMEDVISFAAAFTATALIARITSNTAGHTPAPTERWANSEIADAQLSLSREPHI